MLQVRFRIATETSRGPMAEQYDALGWRETLSPEITHSRYFGPDSSTLNPVREFFVSLCNRRDRRNRYTSPQK